MRIYLLITTLLLSSISMAQNDKGRSLFFGVTAGTKIANNNHAWRYSGYYSHFGTDRTQLEHTLMDNPTNYTTIRDMLSGYDYIVPFDAYSLNIRYTPGLLTGLTLGYQISPNLQMNVEGNFNRLKVRDIFTIEVYDFSGGASQPQYRQGQIYAEESRFDGRFNFDYVADGIKAKFIIGGSLLYSFWRMDEHLAIFNNYTMALFSQFSNIPPGENNVVRGGGLGLGANLGVEYRINQKIVSQIMYQPYHSSVDYGVSINKRILLQHDIIVRFLWK